MCSAEALPEAGSAPTWLARFSIGSGNIGRVGHLRLASRVAVAIAADRATRYGSAHGIHAASTATIRRSSRSAARSSRSAARSARRRSESTRSGCPPGIEGPEHDEVDTGHEEVYIVLEGSGTFTIDGEAVRRRRRRLPPRRRRRDAAGGSRAGRDDVHRRRRQAEAGVRRPRIPVTGVTGLITSRSPRRRAVSTAARAFYGGLLRLHEIEKPPLLAVRGGCWFSLGDGELHVGVEDPFRPATKAHPALLVGSVAGSRGARCVARRRRATRSPGPTMPRSRASAAST